MTDQFLTLEEVTALPEVAEKTVCATAQTGEIPAFEIRGQRRIERTELDPWMDAQPRGGDSGGENDDDR